MFSELLFLGSPIAPVPTASKHPEGLDFPAPDTGTEGQPTQITGARWRHKLLGLSHQLCQEIKRSTHPSKPILE